MLKRTQEIFWKYFGKFLVDRYLDQELLHLDDTGCPVDDVQFAYKVCTMMRHILSDE